MRRRTTGPTPRTARLAVFRWINRYNTVRRHFRLGQLSPIDYDKTFAGPS
ncbi:hypothetical protein GCM10023334_087910 [Nonomuraea thailandensis]